MIFESLWQLATQLLTFILQGAPSLDSAADAVVQADGFFMPVMQGAVSLSPWLPWETLAWCIGVSFAWWVGFLMLKIARAVVAHLPFIGGAG